MRDPDLTSLDFTIDTAAGWIPTQYDLVDFWGFPDLSLDDFCCLPTSGFGLDGAKPVVRHPTVARRATTWAVNARSTCTAPPPPWSGKPSLRYAAVAVLSCLSASCAGGYCAAAGRGVEEPLGTCVIAADRRTGGGGRRRDSLGIILPSSAAAASQIEAPVTVITSLAVAASAVGLCLPGTSTLGVFFLCTLLGAEESWAWARHIRPVPLRGPRPTVSRPDMSHELALDPAMQLCPMMLRSSLPAARPPTAPESFPARCGCALRPGSGRAASTWPSAHRLPPRPSWR